MTSGKSVIIRLGTIAEVVSLSQLIPEFANPHEEQEYGKRLKNKSSLILIAEYRQQAVGFKVGYQKEIGGSFYSWMGGVLPDFRQMGVAKKLSAYQEGWAKDQGYKSIRFKTRNYLKGMLIFGLKNGFNIISVENRPEVGQNRILLEKQLNE